MMSENEGEIYIETAESTSGVSAIRFLNRSETALKSYEGVPKRSVNTYLRLIEDIIADLR